MGSQLFIFLNIFNDIHIWLSYKQIVFALFKRKIPVFKFEKFVHLLPLTTKLWGDNSATPSSPNLPLFLLISIISFQELYEVFILRKKYVPPHIYNYFLELCGALFCVKVCSSSHLKSFNFAQVWEAWFMFPTRNLLRRRLFSSSVGWTDLCFFIISSINWKLRLIFQCTGCKITY